MRNPSQGRGSWVAALAALPLGVLAQGTSPAPKAPETEMQLVEKLQQKSDEAKALQDRAVAVTKSLGELAASGKLPTSDEAINLMRKMLDEMSAIRQRMDAVSAEVAEIKAWIGRHEDAKPRPAADGAFVKSVKPAGYLQFQYRDTDQKGGASDAFSARRVRFGATAQIDPKTRAKFVGEFASGTGQTSSLLKEAFMTYDFDPTKKTIDLSASAGQMPIPVGYEVSRSSSEREFPEHAQYNQKFFSGENGRGVNLKYGVGNGWSIEIGGWNALAAGDPEQSNLAPGPESRLAMTGALRFRSPNAQFGVSGFAGERPSFVSGSGVSAVTHSRQDREFLYVDGAIQGFLDPRIDLRGEAMFGKDRLPVTGTPSSPVTRTDVSGYHLQITYKLDGSNHLHARVEQFDRDTDTPGNAISGIGAAWTHYLNPDAKITASHEIFDDAARSGPGVRQQRYGVTTIRVQFRF